MNLSMEKKQHINSVLDDRTLGWLFPVLETGQSACRSFMKLNEEFFSCSEYLNSVPGHLLSYGINKQLVNQSKIAAFPFELQKEVINRRNGYSIPVLKKKDVTISIMRSTNRLKIDRENINYLNKKCIKNNELSGQLSIFETNIREAENYHAVLLYGCKKDWESITFADVIFFDDKLKEIVHVINIVDKLHIYESTMTDEDKEKSLLNSDNIIKDFKKQMEG